MYIVLNTAISHRWGMPEPCPVDQCSMCWHCYDCTNPGETTSMHFLYIFPSIHIHVSYIFPSICMSHTSFHPSICMSHTSFHPSICMSHTSSFHPSVHMHATYIIYHRLLYQLTLGLNRLSMHPTRGYEGMQEPTSCNGGRLH